MELLSVFHDKICFSFLILTRAEKATRPSWRLRPIMKCCILVPFVDWKVSPRPNQKPEDDSNKIGFNKSGRALPSFRRGGLLLFSFISVSSLDIKRRESRRQYTSFSQLDWLKSKFSGGGRTKSGKKVFLHLEIYEIKFRLFTSCGPLKYPSTFFLPVTSKLEVQDKSATCHSALSKIFFILDRFEKLFYLNYSVNWNCMKLLLNVSE